MRKINGYYASKNINKDREFTTTLLINDGSLCLWLTDFSIVIDSNDFSNH